MAKTFKGKINLDIRESKPDWDAFLDPKAPKSAPNVLVILYDDTGQAAWSPALGFDNGLGHHILPLSNALRH